VCVCVCVCVYVFVCTRSRMFLRVNTRVCVSQASIQYGRQEGHHSRKCSRHKFSKGLSIELYGEYTRALTLEFLVCTSGKRPTRKSNQRRPTVGQPLMAHIHIQTRHLYLLTKE
jgi:hypothetical protein